MEGHEWDGKVRGRESQTCGEVEKKRGCLSEMVWEERRGVRNGRGVTVMGRSGEERLTPVMEGRREVVDYKR